MKLLYAEDEPALSEAVVDYLTYHKYIVDAVYNGEDAYDYAISGGYDGIILDIMMPKRDGLEVLSALRRNGCRTPVLLLTAKTQVEDRIQGLDTGADDYLPKPFDMGELIARIRAMLRRREEYHPDLIRGLDARFAVRGNQCGGDVLPAAKAGVPRDGAAHAQSHPLSVLGAAAGQGLGIRCRNRPQHRMAVYLLSSQATVRDGISGGDCLQEECRL